MAVGLKRMVNYYKCSECGKEVRIEFVDQNTFKCKKCGHTRKNFKCVSEWRVREKQNTGGESSAR